MTLALFAATILVVLMTLIHYEALRILSIALPRLDILNHRARVLAVVLVCFVAHIAEIWLLAGGLYVMAEHAGLGRLASAGQSGFGPYLYLATESYTTLGYNGQDVPGSLRIFAGAGGLAGLLLIAWSASFTYLVMRKYWPLPAVRRDPADQPAPATIPFKQKKSRS